MEIPFVSFAPMEQELDIDITEAFNRVYNRSWYIDGIEDEILKKNSQNFVGHSFVLAQEMD